MLLGPSPFFRREGMERARAEGRIDLLERGAAAPQWDARVWSALGLGTSAPASLLQDPVPAVREAALRALDRSAPESRVLELLKDPDDAVRCAAVWALRDSKRPSPIQPLTKDPFVSVRFAALAVRGEFARLRESAERENVGEGVVALAALGRRGGPAEAAYLLGRLQKALAVAAKERQPLFWREGLTPDIAVARAVGEMARRGVELGGKPLSDHVLRLLASTEPVSGQAILLAEAVAGARDLRGAQAILDAHLGERIRSPLADSYLDEVTLSVIDAFSREPWREIGPILAPYLSQRSRAVRAAAAGALLGEAAAAALADDDPIVRAAACAGVERASSLLPLAEDRDGGVAAACARALGRIGGAEAAKGLALLSSHRREEARRAAAGAWMRVDAPERDEKIYAAALSDPEDSVRAAAAAALALLGQSGAVERALADLTQPELATRRNAHALLLALTPARHPFDPATPQAGAEVWRAWWAGKGKRDLAPDAFRYHVEDMRRRGLDLVVCVDATGSMAATIQATKRRIASVVSALRTLVLDVRVRVVAYRDRSDEFLAVGSPLTHDPRALEDFLSAVTAAGGGDFEEAVLEGLREATTGTPFRPKAQKVVVLFGDAPPHPEEMALVEATAKEFKGTINLVGIGRDPRTEAEFRRIAAWGRGAFVGSGGGEREILRHLLVLALGADHRAAIEALLD